VHFGGAQHIGAVAAGADGEQHIAGLAVRLHETREHLVEAVVVAHAGEVARVTDADRGDGCAIIAELAGKLLGEVHGIAHAAAIAAADDLAPLLQAGHHEAGRTFHGLQVGQVGTETLQGRRLQLKWARMRGSAGSWEGEDAERWAGGRSRPGPPQASFGRLLQLLHGLQAALQEGLVLRHRGVAHGIGEQHAHRD
jgi:hypothetical protein